MFLNSQGKEVWIETFLMAYHMAQGMQATVGLSCLASLYSCLDTITDNKRSPYTKNSDLQIYYLLGWLATYCPKTYNTQTKVAVDLPLFKIVGAIP